MLAGIHLATAQRIALGHWRQHFAIAVVVGVVQILAVEFEEAVEGEDGAGGAEARPVALAGLGQFHRDLVQFGGLHL